MNEEQISKLLELYKEEELEVVEEGDWVDNGKYSFQSDIVEHEGKFYEIHNARSGSYHSDYYYNDPEFVGEVKQVEKVVKVWKAVK